MVSNPEAKVTAMVGNSMAQLRLELGVDQQERFLEKEKQKK